MAADSKEAFPAINLMPDRERVMGGYRPKVRPWFWVMLALSVLVLIAVMAMELIPRLLQQMGR
ncbi:MAG TPA: hypothetical protein VG329_11260 [Candidatus Dormibacteraeota bacterium]|jgi:hypothetical protein|nr:hypothetical protein [Candidatus Dormibacteraeota bacterium]